jgi:hypothetical protein
VGWNLMRGSERVARLEQVDLDMPWFICSFRPERGFAELEPLFREQERLLEAEDWDGAEALWSELFAQAHVVADERPDERISEFLIRFHGADEVWLRY